MCKNITIIMIYSITIFKFIGNNNCNVKESLSRDCKRNNLKIKLPVVCSWCFRKAALLNSCFPKAPTTTGSLIFKLFLLQSLDNDSFINTPNIQNENSNILHITHYVTSKPPNTIMGLLHVYTSLHSLSLVDIVTACFG